MKNTWLALSLPGMLVALLGACGEEDTHEHVAEDFATLAECQAHYEEEGHSADEITELCAGLT
jgi:hypothetical protein